MTTTGAYPLPRERNLILALLIILAVVAWAILIWQRLAMASMDEMGMGGAMGLTQGMGALLFLGMWVAMMVAMMFPTAAPMILMFTRVYASKRERGQAFVPTWVFVAGYLVVWVLFGVVAYGVAVGAEALAARIMWLMDNAARLGGGLLVLAGLYQLSPLKRACLAKCRSPLSFILTSWRDGHAGAFRMGLLHGLYCLGCCWLLFLLLIPLGIMNVAVMVLITLLIFAEKSLVIGPKIGRVVAVGLLVYGVVVMLYPSALPTLL
jgi:predicted metal-binding membrane protein